ncbi:MAG: hypothetical protein KGL39_07950 [Patescibacteria group bacterium]|nr:hypothetical protein [Patescibacteria group bacterium]
MKCKPPPRGRIFESDSGQCPHCGAEGTHAVFELVYVHFIVMGSGPIFGAHGKQHVACEPNRDGLSIRPGDCYAASEDPRATTCPGCMGTKAWQAASAAMASIDKNYRLRLQIEEAAVAAGEVRR